MVRRYGGRRIPVRDSTDGARMCFWPLAQGMNYRHERSLDSPEASRIERYRS